jgi:hypothetical protein
LTLFSAPASAQHFLNQFSFRKQTKYFDFRYRHYSTNIAEIARFSDAFIGTVNRDFFKAEFSFPIRVLVLENRDKYLAFLRRDLAVENPPNFGIYIYPLKMFVTYEAAGLGTFSHEIMHPLVETNLTDRPAWTIEGVPAFFEKFYGYWKGGELVIKWGYQNPWRIAQLGTNLTRLNLKPIISIADSDVERHESALRMASIFLWDQGKFIRFLKLIQAKDKAGYPSYFEAAMEMPLEKIVPVWRDYLKAVAQQRDAILKLPPSAILQNEAEFERFAKQYNISTNQVMQQN